MTDTTSTRVLLFGARQLPRALQGLPAASVDNPDAVPALLDDLDQDTHRLIVVGADADLASVLTRLMRTEKLGVELGFVPDRNSPARRIYGLRFGTARRARSGRAHRMPLIRDDAGTALVGQAAWRGAQDGPVTGEATVDDTLLFHGSATVDIEPTGSLPGVRARAGRGRWLTGRAVQLGTTGARVIRDGVPGPRTVTRSTFYRHEHGWLLVR